MMDIYFIEGNLLGHGLGSHSLDVAMGSEGRARQKCRGTTLLKVCVTQYGSMSATNAMPKLIQAAAAKAKAKGKESDSVSRDENEFLKGKQLFANMVHHSCTNKTCI